MSSEHAGAREARQACSNNGDSLTTGHQPPRFTRKIQNFLRTASPNFFLRKVVMERKRRRLTVCEEVCGGEKRSRRHHETGINEVPYELLILVFGFLDMRDVIRSVRLVCRE